MGVSKFCPECGNPIPYASARFCPNCGTRLEAAEGDKKQDAAPARPEGGEKQDTVPVKPESGKKRAAAPAKRKSGKVPDTAPIGPEEDKKPDTRKRDPSVTEPVGTPLALGTSEVENLDKDTLTGKPKEELIDIILGQEVIERKATDEISFDVSKIPFRTAFDKGIDTSVKRFLRLPVGPSRRQDLEDFATWRVTLVSAHPDHKLLALELHDDVIVGRVGSGIKPDLDLTRYGGGILGVSRRHALLRPSTEGLQLIDLGSTNGTFCNGSRINAGVACPLEESSVISFAGVHFLVYSLGKV
jgi:hypothetical protein